MKWTEEELATLKRVYQIATWPGIHNALPGRARKAISKKAEEIGVRRRCRPVIAWKVTEEARLREAYPEAPWTKLLEMFPGHSQTAIKRKAGYLGVKRQTRKVKPSKFLLVRQLQQIRLQAGLSQRQLAEKLKSDRSMLSAWERGIYTIKLDSLMKWADALDVRFNIVPKMGKGNAGNEKAPS